MARTKREPSSKKQKMRWFYKGVPSDKPFLLILAILLLAGLICMFSASYVNGYYYQDDSYYFIKKQMWYVLAGCVGMLIFSYVDYHVWHRMSYVVYGIALILLIVVLCIPTKDGVQRWIPLPGVGNIQPSEVAKFALIVVFAHLISINHKKMKEFKKGYVPFIIAMLILCLFTAMEPHLSGTILIFAIGFSMMFVGGTRLVYLLGTVLLGGGAVMFAVFVLGYEKDRIDVWLRLFETYEINRDQAWQTMQSLYAIGSGGIMGQGFGGSRQKHLFLPEPQNDFVFSVVCEEFGFVGAVIVLVLFAVLVWRGYVIATRAPDKFGFMLAVGLSIQIGIQVALNVAVVTNSMPNTGISLPFFSFGGSSMIMLLCQMGILLSISRHSTKKLA